MRRPERAGGGVRALPSVQSAATPSPDVTDEASMSNTALSRRTDDHLDIVLDRRTAPATVAAGWEYIRFEHCALPELDLTQIDPACLAAGQDHARVAADQLHDRRHATRRGHQPASKRGNATLGIAICAGSQHVSLQSRNSQGLTRAQRRRAPDTLYWPISAPRNCARPTAWTWRARRWIRSNAPKVLRKHFGLRASRRCSTRGR